MLHYRLLALTVIAVSLVSLIVISGCSSFGISGGIGAAKPANLTKEQKSQLISKLPVKFINRYPNDQGLVRFFGEFSNQTDRHLISATVIATDVKTKGMNDVFGKTTINDIKPDEIREFEIVSGLSLDQVGDQVEFIVIDAKFQ